MNERPVVYTNRLQCVECGRVSRENERGWTARLTVDDQVAVFCSSTKGRIGCSGPGGELNACR